MFEVGNAPMRSLSPSSWTMWPGEGSALPIMEIAERMGMLGCGRKNGFSMLRPFCRRIRVVLLLFLGRAGVIRSTAVGETSGMFLVQRTT